MPYYTEMKTVATREFSPFQQGVAQYLCRSDIHEPNTVSNANLLSLLSHENQLTKKLISLLPWEIFRSSVYICILCSVYRLSIFLKCWLYAYNIYHLTHQVERAKLLYIES